MTNHVCVTEERSTRSTPLRPETCDVAFDMAPTMVTGVRPPMKIKRFLGQPTTNPLG